MQQARLMLACGQLPATMIKSSRCALRTQLNLAIPLLENTIAGNSCRYGKICRTLGHHDSSRLRLLMLLLLKQLLLACLLREPPLRCACWRGTCCLGSCLLFGRSSISRWLLVICHRRKGSDALAAPCSSTNCSHHLVEAGGLQPLQLIRVVLDGVVRVCIGFAPALHAKG